MIPFFTEAIQLNKGLQWSVVTVRNLGLESQRHTVIRKHTSLSLWACFILFNINRTQFRASPFTELLIDIALSGQGLNMHTLHSASSEVQSNLSPGAQLKKQQVSTTRQRALVMMELLRSIMSASTRPPLHIVLGVTRNTVSVYFMLP